MWRWPPWKNGEPALVQDDSSAAHSIPVIQCICCSLLQERMEMARLAEEVARQTAEMAVRQMASEGTSIKLSLESQELLEEPEAE